MQKAYQVRKSLIDFPIFNRKLSITLNIRLLAIVYKRVYRAVATNDLQSN